MLPESESLNSPVLDAGCGTGMLAQLWPHKALSGIDLSAAMCREARHRNSYSHIQQADMEAMPFANESFAGVVSSLAMQWLASPNRFFAEAARVTNADGWLAIATLTDGTLSRLSQAYEQAGLNSTLLRFLSIDSIENTLCNEGWHIEQATQVIEEQHYDSVFALLKSMQHIGATSSSHKPALRHKGDVAQIEAAYRTLSSEADITAQWHGYLCIAKKR